MQVRQCLMTGIHICLHQCAGHGTNSVRDKRAFTAKCSKPQAVIREDMSEGSGVAILLSVRIET